MAEYSVLWILAMILVAFAGGAFGSALGALPAFIFTGFIIIVGEAASILHTDIVTLLDGESVKFSADYITSSIGFGPVFGPHVSFAAGTAASAYAAKKGYMDTAHPYFDAKNIAYALGPKPDVMFVGGMFGILGFGITQISAAFSLPWDPIAMGVVLSAVVHRLVFRYPMIGEHKNGLFNMKPFEMGLHREGSEGANIETNRWMVEPWLPHQYKWNEVAFLGLIVGMLAAFITYKTGSVFLPFGISAATLVFLNCGVENTPVTHHMSLIASAIVVVLTGGEYSQVPLYLMIMAGGIAGVVAALTGEVIQRIFFAHSDTHFDPPAAAIVVCTFVIALLAMMGVFPSSAWIPHP